MFDLGVLTKLRCSEAGKFRCANSSSHEAVEGVGEKMGGNISRAQEASIKTLWSPPAP